MTRALLLAMALTLGCAPSDPPPVDAPAAAPCAGAACAECFEDAGRPPAAALVRRAEELDALAATLEAQLGERCVAMVRQLAIPEEAAGLDACPVVRDEIARRLPALFPLGIRLSIAGEPALCHASLEAARACAEACGGPGAAVRCEGELLGACPGRCDGVCHGLCGAACEGTCSDFCDGRCDALCYGFCEGECAPLDRDGRCNDVCDGRCDLGACSGTCSGRCTGVCTEPCGETCAGVCVGTCDGDWQPACHGVVLVASAPCGLACTAAAAMAAECPVPEVRVRGPELEDPRDHGLADQLVLTVSRHYEHVYAIEARIRVTLAPWMDALAALLETAARHEPDSCLAERARAVRSAIARLEALQATSQALFAAAEDAVGAAFE